MPSTCWPDTGKLSIEEETTMKVIVIGTKPNDIKTVETEGRLQDFQALVNGYIQPAAPAQLRQQGIEMLVNEEGLLAGLPTNPNLSPFFYVGVAVLVGIGEESFVGLTQEQIFYAYDWLRDLANEI